MNIGNGPLEIGMLGFSENVELSILELQNLTKSTLEIYPLGDIFHLSDINIIKIPTNLSSKDIGLFEFDEIERFRSVKKELDVIAAINKKELLSRCHLDGWYLHSKLKPMALAHELGHALGLGHFFTSCCGPYLFNELETLDKIRCPNLGYVMCGCESPDKGNRGFSPENIKKLEEWYLK